VSATEADRVRARKCWRTLEPYHAFVYFAPEAAEEYASLGVHRRTGYFLSRSAATGRVSAATVIATFYNFHPGVVAKAMDGVPDGLDVADVTDARYRVVDRVLRLRVPEAIDSAGMARAAHLAGKAAEGLGDQCVGRPLGAAHAALPAPDQDHLRLWWAITALREHRGDGHLAALVDAELSGLEALIVHAASGDVTADVLKATRSWSDDEWADGVDGLVERGLVEPDGTFTADGAELRRRIEDRTDRLASPPWTRLTDAEAAELRDLVRPWSKTVFADADLT
jgi:hypothetical protein